MSKNKIREVALFYKKELEKQGFKSIKGHGLGFNYPDHIIWMCEEITKMHKFGKMNRWLGFIQGYFWMSGFYTVDDMKKHNTREL